MLCRSEGVGARGFLTCPRTGLRMAQPANRLQTLLPPAFEHEHDHPANRFVRPLRARSAFRRTAEVRHESEDGGAGLPDSAYAGRAPRGNGDPGRVAVEALGD